MKNPMEKQEFFSELGFNEYESKALSSLTLLKKASPKELSLASKVPQNKLYQIISKMKARGLLAELPNGNKKYQLINLNTFVKEKLQDKHAKLKQLEISSKILEKLRDKQENFSFQVIIGQKAIMNKLSENNQKCRKEILGVQRNWKYWAEGVRAMQSAIKRGAEVKLIGEISRENKKRVEEWQKIGCNIKHYNKKFGENPLRFSIFDNKEARVTIGKPEIQNPEDYITIWTDSKPLVNMLKNQFMQMWKESKSFDSTC
jgi:sugar-specific transcriptional regulator TrmB